MSLTDVRHRLPIARIVLVGCVACLSCVGAAGLPTLAQQPKRGVPTSEYAIRRVRGWTVRINRRLLKDQRDLGSRAIELLDAKLLDIERAVPARAVAALRRVPIWLGLDDGHAPCAEYHPSREWLEKNGYNPDKARCVEIGNASRFLEWSKTQPSMILHELAHAYHDQVLGFDNQAVAAAYERAKQGGAYESVLHADGSKQRHYAMTDAKEYFAELTEALFGVNDFYPFVRAELKEHDAEGYALLRRLWQIDQ